MKLPEKVTKNLHFIYPKVKILDWSRQNSLFSVNIKVGKQKETILLDSNGIWIGSLYNLHAQDLPDTITRFIHHTFAAYRLDQAYYSQHLIRRPGYIVRLHLRHNPGIKSELFFNLEGNILLINNEYIENTEDILPTGIRRIVHEKASLAKAIYLNEKEDIALEYLHPLQDLVDIGKEEELPEKPEEKAAVEAQEISLLFARHYADAQNTTWREENDLHIASFVYSKQNMEAAFSNTSLVYSVFYIAPKEIPFIIKNYIDNKYPKAKILHCKKFLFRKTPKSSNRIEDLPFQNRFEITLLLKNKKEEQKVLLIYNQNLQLKVEQNL